VKSPSRIYPYYLSASSSLLVDDSPYACYRSGGRAIIIPPFDPAILNDNALLFIAQIVAYMVIVLSADRSEAMTPVVGESTIPPPSPTPDTPELQILTPLLLFLVRFQPIFL